jgi:hypothetical protein
VVANSVAGDCERDDEIAAAKNAPAAPKQDHLT